MRDRLERTSSSWREAAERSPVAKRLEPWADSLLAAARESLACGLEVQARPHAALGLDRLPQPS